MPRFRILTIKANCRTCCASCGALFRRNDCNIIVITFRPFRNVVQYPEALRDIVQHAGAYEEAAFPPGHPVTSNLAVLRTDPHSSFTTAMATSENLLPTEGLRRILSPHPGWGPPALRWYILVFTTFVCWTLIAVLQYYLTKSQREGGVIFAENVNDLPLRRSFVYLYMPTIFATTFSIFIAWIDIDAKRFEPYHQLSQPKGALGRDSLLLHYPFDFMPFVPIVALKNR
jgi:hypothetical protein